MGLVRPDFAMPYEPAERKNRFPKLPRTLNVEVNLKKLWSGLQFDF